ncbi:Transposition protein, TnsC-like protein, partial [Pseudomonas syringae pv. spinaceae]
IRMDLKCPFDIPLRSSIVEFPRREREQRVTTKVFLSSLNAEERAGLEQIKPELLDQTPAKRKSKTSIRKATEEEMLDAHQRFLAETLLITDT